MEGVLSIEHFLTLYDYADLLMQYISLIYRR